MEYNNQQYWNNLVGAKMRLQEVGWPQWTEAFNKARYDFVAKQTVQQLQLPAAPKKILEIGCGIGFWTNIITQLYPNATYTGVDISHHAIANLQQQYAQQVNISFQLLDITTANALLQNEYDVVICMEVLLHITDTNGWQQAVANICKSLQPNGIFFMSEPFLLQSNKSIAPANNNTVRRWSDYETIFKTYQLQVKKQLPRTFLLDNNFDFSSALAQKSWLLFFKFWNKLLCINNEKIGFVLGKIATVVDSIFVKISKKGNSCRLVILCKTQV